MKLPDSYSSEHYKEVYHIVKTNKLVIKNKDDQEKLIDILKKKYLSNEPDILDNISIDQWRKEWWDVVVSIFKATGIDARNTSLRDRCCPKHGDANSTNGCPSCTIHELEMAVI